MGTDDESALVQELRSLARPPTDKSDFVVRSRGYPIDVSYSGGSSSSLSLRARYDAVARADHPALVARAESRGYRDRVSTPLAAARPLDIELRPENVADVAAKAEGLNVEWQSGDAAFDDAVYVSTPTANVEVLAAVLGADVRQAVLDLFALGFRLVCIDEKGEVRASVVEFTSREPREGRGARAIDAFARILANLPVIAASGEVAPPAPFAGLTLLLQIIGVLGWAVNVGYVGIVHATVCELRGKPDADVSVLGVVLAIFAGLVAGGFGGKAYGNLVRARVRGTSLAASRVTRAQIAAFGGGSVIVFTLVFVMFDLAS
jgi:hypothetical protein